MQLIIFPRLKHKIDRYDKYQWRIQDFPGEAPILKGVPSYHLINFYRNCMKMKEFWFGGVRPSLQPPRSVNRCVIYENSSRLT